MNFTPKTRIIHTDNDKFQNSYGLKKWANLQNMKEVSRVINILSKYAVEDNLLRRTERNERARRVFNTMDALQYANLLRETIEEYGCPAIFNTDQGSQFTSILNATKQ